MDSRRISCSQCSSSPPDIFWQYKSSSTKRTLSTSGSRRSILSAWAGSINRIQLPIFATNWILYRFQCDAALLWRSLWRNLSCILVEMEPLWNLIGLTRKVIKKSAQLTLKHMVCNVPMTGDMRKSCRWMIHPSDFSFSLLVLSDRQLLLAYDVGGECV